MQLTLTIPTLAETDQFKKTFRTLYEDHHVFCFHGELGAGKTTYIKVLCEDIGVQDEMNSPTFSIVNTYQSNKAQPIYHFDLYRLNSPNELEAIGWDEYVFSDGILFIEWPENAGNHIPDDAVHVYISADHHSAVRTVTITD